jgi:hypothetical protein
VPVARFLGVAPPLETVVIGNKDSFESIRIKASLSPSLSVIGLEICKRGMLRAKMVGCLRGETSRCFPSISKDELVVFKLSANRCSSERAKGKMMLDYSLLKDYEIKFRSKGGQT